MTFTIPNITFVILIGISTAYLTFLTTKGSLTDNKYSNLYKRLTKRGKLVMSVLIFMLLLLIGQELNNQNVNYNKDLLLSKERNQRDESIKKGIDSNTEKIFENLSIAFAKQGLQIDLVNNSIIRIKDSIKTTVNYYNQPDPVLMVDTTGVFIKKNINAPDNFGIGFKSRDAGLTNIKVTCYLLTGLDNGTMDLSKINFFPDNLTLAKNTIWKTGWGNTIENVKFVYIHVTGSYKNINRTRNYKIDDVYHYNAVTKKTSILLNLERNRILKIMSSVPEKDFTIH